MNKASKIIKIDFIKDGIERTADIPESDFPFFKEKYKGVLHGESREEEEEEEPKDAKEEQVEEGLKEEPKDAKEEQVEEDSKNAEEKSKKSGKRGRPKKS